MGLKACEYFDLINRVNTVGHEDQLRWKVESEFPSLFRGLGCAKRPYKMVLRENSTPVVQPARRVPHALRAPLKAELDRMEEAGVIVKAQEPSDWVSPLVIVRKKNNKLRICMDPRHINEALKREHFQLPRREEIEADLAHAAYFSRLDANSGFHQIPLDDGTSRICTFSTPFGRYRFLRLPFGLASAPEVFQRTMSYLLDGLPGVRVYIDDVLIWGATLAEHDQRLHGVLTAIQAEGLTLNFEKCVFLG